MLADLSLARLHPASTTVTEMARTAAPVVTRARGWRDRAMLAGYGAPAVIDQETTSALSRLGRRRPGIGLKDDPEKAA